MKRYIIHSATDADIKSDDLQKAIDLINRYCDAEYGDPYDDNHYDVGADGNLSDIGIMYTTSGGNNEVDLQVSADLVNNKMNYYVNSELRHTDSFKDLKDFIDSELSNLDFDILYSTALDYVTDDDYDPEYSADYMRGE